MLCRSCKKNVDSSMKHAITANLCPFCGNPIFTAKELNIRKGISRVLIKNGLERDDVINKIVDDILELASGAVPAEEPVAQVQSQPQVDVTVDPNERGEDGLTSAERNAPARTLTAAPRPTAQAAAPGGVDPFALASQVFAEENSDPMSRPYNDARVGSGDDDNVEGIFFMERGGGEKVEKLRQAAASAQRAGVGRPSFVKKG